MSDPKRRQSANDEDTLAGSVRELRKAVDVLRKQQAPIVDLKVSLLHSFLKGAAGVLGALAAVAIIVPLFVWLLRGIQWTPIVGDAVSKVIDRIEQSQERAR